MLPGNVKITLPEAEDVSIEQLVNDFSPDQEIHVCSHNVSRSSNTIETVAMTRTTSARDFVLLEFEDGSNLMITADHQVFDSQQSKWTRAGVITPGGELRGYDHVMNVIKVHNVRNDLSDRVYNINLTGHSCFFANNVLIKC